MKTDANSSPPIKTRELPDYADHDSGDLVYQINQQYLQCSQGLVGFIDQLNPCTSKPDPRQKKSESGRETEIEYELTEGLKSGDKRSNE